MTQTKNYDEAEKNIRSTQPTTDYINVYYSIYIYTYIPENGCIYMCIDVTRE